MLSYKTVIAIQLLSLLKCYIKTGVTFTKIQTVIGREHNIVIRKALAILTKERWIATITGNRWRIEIDLETKTLTDLIIILDGGFQLDGHVKISQWNKWAEQSCKEAIKLDTYIEEYIKDTLKKVVIKDLITQ